MALKIVTASEPILVNAIKVVIYGDPSLGKTSLAYTAKRPILFDFDDGAHRSQLRQGDTVIIEKWDEVAKVTAKDLESYDTVIVDTVGRAQDKIIKHMRTSGASKAFQSDGALSQKGYGQMADILKTWTNQLIAMGKDVVFIAHSKEKRGKKEEDTLIRPDVAGSMLGELYKLADQMGYLSMTEDENGKSVKTMLFRPTTGYHTKDSGGLGNFTLPDLKTNPRLLANIIDDIKTNINSMGVENAKLQAELDAFRGDCMSAENAQDFNELKARLNADHPFYAPMRQAMLDAVGLAKVSFDKEQNCFVDDVEGAA